MKATLLTLFTNLALRSQAAKATLKDLGNSEKKRLNKLIALHTRLRTGKHVQNRALQNNLTPKQFTEMQECWEREKQSRLDRYGVKPEEIVNYEIRVKQADFAYIRGDAYSQRGKHSVAKKLLSQSDTLYELAREYLEERLSAQPSLQSWLDRDLDTSDLLGPSTIPRVRTSRSIYNQSRLSYGSIMDTKIYAVECAIFELAFERMKVKPSSNSSKLLELLKNLDVDDDT